MILTLKPRANNKWHDAVVVINAIDAIASQMTMIKASLWITLAARIQSEAERITLESPGQLQPVTIEISDHEADLLWRNMIRLRPEQFGRDASGALAAPHFGTLSIMLQDIATQLGEKFSRGADEE